MKNDKILTFNYFKNGVAITKSQFESNVPTDYREHLNEYFEYSWGSYKAILRD